MDSSSFREAGLCLLPAPTPPEQPLDNEQAKLSEVHRNLFSLLCSRRLLPHAVLAIFKAVYYQHVNNLS